MFQRNFLTCLLIWAFLSAAGCTSNPLKPGEPQPVPLGAIPAQRLNYRFEPDVPAPVKDNKTPVQSDQRNEAVQLDFDNNRPLEILDRTITSPDKKRVIAVYRKPEDLTSEFRLDIYLPDGKPLRRITHEEMAVHFPDTIRWSPDSKSFAFVAMVRGQTKDIDEKEAKKEPTPKPTIEPEVVDRDEDKEKKKEEIPEANENANANTNTETNTARLEPAKDVITFRTEQIYLTDADGLDVKPLTQNEGLIYFYFVWAPDNSALAALAATITEWRIREARARNAGEIFIPQGRPKVVETTGRQRLLDDYTTPVHPVWSPDSAKVATAFNKQVRIYDAKGEQPTSAGIPLNNDLLLASKAYEEKQKAEGKEFPTNTNSEGNSNANTQETPETKTTLPDPRSLVSFNPIINLEWDQETLLYLQTGYLKNFTDATENVSSYLRWHRLVLSPQAMTISNK